MKITLPEYMEMRLNSAERDAIYSQLDDEALAYVVKHTLGQLPQKSTPTRTYPELLQLLSLELLERNHHTVVLTKAQDMVRQFRTKFEQTVNTKPTFPSEADRKLAIKLITQELTEFIAGVHEEDMVEVADGLADILYVVLGACVVFGIEIGPIFEEVHTSNMTKVWPDGTIHKDADGKVVKPSTYQVANVRAFLTLQGFNDLTPGCRAFCNATGRIGTIKGNLPDGIVRMIWEDGTKGYCERKHLAVPSA